MGNGHSSEVGENGNEKICSRFHSTADEFFLNIRAPNFIHLVDASNEVLQNLVKSLEPTTRSVRPVWRPNAYEIELFGSPFVNDTNTNDHPPPEIAFCRFLAALHGNNWRHYVSMNLSPFCDRSTCYFRRNSTQNCTASPQGGTKQLPVVFSVSFLTHTTIQLAASGEHCVAPFCTLIQTALYTVLESYPLNGKISIHQPVYECARMMSIHLDHGKSESSLDSILNGRFLLEIVSQLQNSGYRLSACVDFRGTADTLFFTVQNPVDRKEDSPAGVYCLLTAHQWNLLRLYEAPRDLIDVTRLLIHQHWQAGVEAESARFHWHEFQLAACPWAARAGDAAQSRSLFTHLLQTCLARGWRPVASVQMSRTFSDRSCVVLRKENPGYRPHICLGLLECNELNLINAEDDLRDFVLDFACSDAMIRNKPSRPTSKCGWPVITLRGTPWCNENGKGGGHNGKVINEYDWLKARAFVQNLMVLLRYRGWEPVINVDLAARVRYRRKSSAGSNCSRSGNPCGKVASTDQSIAENSIPLDVNSLILANVNGSRHNSLFIPKQANGTSRFILRPQMSLD